MDDDIFLSALGSYMSKVLSLRNEALQNFRSKQGAKESSNVVFLPTEWQFA
jgi:hypothetical protein